MRVAIFTFFIFAIGITGFSAIAEARGGHYAGGRGSSHRGGSYRNSATGNHYQHR